MTVSKNASYRQAKCPPGCNLLRRTEKSNEKSTEKSTGKVCQVDQDSTEASYRKRNQKSTVKSTKSIKILLKPPFESTTMKSTGWSPMRTSKDDYLVNRIWESMPLPAARHILQSMRKHCTKAQESLGARTW